MKVALVAMLVVLVAASALTAQEPTYGEVKAKLAGATLADWLGYQKEPFCVRFVLNGCPP